jgi:hypothetical protein
MDDFVLNSWNKESKIFVKVMYFYFAKNGIQVRIHKATNIIPANEQLSWSNVNTRKSRKNMRPIKSEHITQLHSLMGNCWILLKSEVMLGSSQEF